MPEERRQSPTSPGHPTEVEYKPLEVLHKELEDLRKENALLRLALKEPSHG